MDEKKEKKDLGEGIGGEESELARDSKYSTITEYDEKHTMVDKESQRLIKQLLEQDILEEEKRRIDDAKRKKKQRHRPSQQSSSKNMDIYELGLIMELKDRVQTLKKDVDKLSTQHKGKKLTAKSLSFITDSPILFGFFGESIFDKIKYYLSLLSSEGGIASQNLLFEAEKNKLAQYFQELCSIIAIELQRETEKPSPSIEFLNALSQAGAKLIKYALSFQSRGVPVNTLELSGLIHEGSNLVNTLQESKKESEPVKKSWSFATLLKSLSGVSSSTNSATTSSSTASLSSSVSSRTTSSSSSSQSTGVSGATMGSTSHERKRGDQKLRLTESFGSPSSSTMTSTSVGPTTPLDNFSSTYTKK